MSYDVAALQPVDAGPVQDKSTEQGFTAVVPLAGEGVEAQEGTVGEQQPDTLVPGATTGFCVDKRVMLPAPIIATRISAGNDPSIERVTLITSPSAAGKVKSSGPVKPAKVILVKTGIPFTVTVTAPPFHPSP